MRRLLLSSRREREEFLKGRLDLQGGDFFFDGTKVFARFMSKAFGCSNDLQCAVKATDCAAEPASTDPLPRFNRRRPVAEAILEFLTTLSATNSRGHHA